MATLYFNGAVDTDWATLGNWWTDDAFTTQASALPTSSDSVVLIGAACDTNSGSAPTVVNLTLNGGSNLCFIGIAITVTGDATFNDGAFNNAWALTGDATFNGYSYNNANVTGDATFNDGSLNFGGTVGGDVTFNVASTMSGGSVSGNATFSGNAKQTGGTVTGNATFNGSSRMEGGSVEGNSTFNDTSLLNGYNYPSTYGTVVLNDYATANGSWTAGGDPTTFNDHANLSGPYYTGEPCEFNHHATCNGLGMGGGATFNDFSVCAGVVEYGYPIFTFNDSATGGFDVPFGGWGSSPEPAVTYNDRSYGSGKAKTLTINGAAVMQNAYLNGYDPVLYYSFTRPQYGINGSSILGVI